MRRKSYINLAKMIKLPSLAQVANESPKQLDDQPNSDGIVENKSLSRAIRHLRKMSDDELRALISADDDFVLDCLIDQTPLIKRLERERDDLKKQVTNLCSFNYAREPEYVRDRMKIREIVEDTAALRKRIIRSQQPLLEHLSKMHCQITLEARKFEEESEKMAQEFLAGNMNYDEFIRLYVEVRRQATRKRALADRLAKERNTLADNVPKVNVTNSPIPTPRQRKKVSIQK